MKRFFDFTVSLLMILLLLPVFILTGIIIAIDAGNPVIYKQYRVGKDNKLFYIYKFRTMKNNTRLAATKDLTEADSVITKSGRILRKTSLDELPQLFNVLKGDMSFVGPRPLIPEEKEIRQLRKEYGIYSVRPGITGWAQVNGRDGEIGFVAPQPEPVVTFVESQAVVTAEPTSVSEATPQTPQPVAVSQPTRQPIDYTQWLCILYIIGVSVAVGIRLWQFIRMDRLIRTGCLWHDTVDGITIYCHASDIAPYSWMRRIVISQHDYDNHRHEILLHERGHVLCHHSWDILLLMIVQTVQWFNPFVYMFGASLRDVHEYEADDYVLRQGVSAGQYQTLLLKTAVGASAYSFANNFNHSKLKSRIEMMKHKKINPWMRCKVLYTLPIILISLCLFASPDKEQRVTIAKPKLEVIGKKTHFSYDGAYIYNPERNDSHLYAGYYYTAEQLDSIFGERTKTYYDEGWAAYVYEHEGVRIEMAHFLIYEII